MNKKKEVRVRFAPSPTGHLHVGSVRSALFNWLFARHNNGCYVVRIEDTDVERSKKEYVDSISNSLKWLGLESDESALFQSDRIKEHKKTIHDLLDKKRVYPCFCEPKSAETKVVEHSVGSVSSYDGTCRDKAYSTEDLSRPHAIRFKVPRDKESLTFSDEIRGDITIPLDSVDDFVIARRDGTPTYNLVVVIDDIFMNISHVIRGEDHISNTPKQILLYQALESSIPIFAHIPLILGPSGNRLSKRDAAVSVEEYRKAGFLADALFNYLVRLGWSHGDQEVFSREELIEFFTLDNVGKKGSIFDIKKLEWLNGFYIRKLSFQDVIDAVGVMSPETKTQLEKAWKNDQLKELIAQYKERAVNLKDMSEAIVSFSKDPEELNLDLCKKWLKPQTPDVLLAFATKIKDLKDINHDTLLELARSVCDAHEVKLVALAQPIRLALTGSVQSPGIFELVSILGIEKSIRRIERLLDILNS
jgi:glutamyl-tRNA synthetase